MNDTGHVFTGLAEMVLIKWIGDTMASWIRAVPPESQLTGTDAKLQAVEAGGG
jgi:hypothetical protein